jgi:hypothetical protein
MEMIGFWSREDEPLDARREKNQEATLSQPVLRREKKLVSRKSVLNWVENWWRNKFIAC